MRRFLVRLFFGVLVTISAIGISYARGHLASSGPVDYAPMVRQISPVGETVDLTGKDGILFRWSWMEGDRMQRQYYDFRIYRGYDALESTLIYKDEVARDADRIYVKADIFKDGQTYTWSIRQRYYGMAKSRRNYASFRVIKR